MKAEDLRPISNRQEALQIKLPPRPGSVCALAPQSKHAARYPLRGTAVYYEQPTEPVGERDWETLK